MADELSCFTTYVIMNTTILSPCLVKLISVLILLFGIILTIFRINKQPSSIPEEQQELLNSEHSISSKLFTAFNIIMVWVLIGELAGVMVRFLPNNNKLPIFTQPQPPKLHFILYITQFLLWFSTFLIDQEFRFYIYVSSTIGSSLELAMTFIYMVSKAQPWCSDFTLSTEILIGLLVRWGVSVTLVISCIYFSSKDYDEEVEDPDFNPPTSWLEFYSYFKKLIPYFWPRGTLYLQLMLMGCLLCIFLGRYANLMVPIQYKAVVDSLSDVIVRYYQTGNFDIQSVGKIPKLEIGLFVLFRMLAGSNGLLSAIQTALWVPIGQHTTKNVSMGMFQHLHALSLRFHLNRKTGEILRVQDRGVSSIVSLLSSLLFNVFPTLADIFVACLFFSYQFDLYFGFIVFSTMLAYIWSTAWVTEWRTKYRRGANKFENAMEAKAVDSLINFETVKYFSAEQFEAKQYEGAIDNFQKAELVSIASMWLLDSLQNIIINTGLLVGCLLCAKRILIDQVMTVGDFGSYC